MVTVKKRVFETIISEFLKSERQIQTFKIVGIPERIELSDINIEVTIICEVLYERDKSLMELAKKIQVEVDEAFIVYFGDKHDKIKTHVTFSKMNLPVKKVRKIGR